MHGKSYCCQSVHVCPSVCLSIVFLGNHGSSERETWTCYQVQGIDFAEKAREAAEKDGCHGEKGIN